MANLSQEKNQKGYGCLRMFVFFQPPLEASSVFHQLPGILLAWFKAVRVAGLGTTEFVSGRRAARKWHWGFVEPRNTAKLVVFPFAFL